MFLHLPDHGWPSVIDAEPTDAHASDLLGGAIPVRLGVSENFGVLVREDCRGLPLNVAASYICSLISRGPMVVPGPAVIVQLDTVAAEVNDDGIVRVLATPENFQAEDAMVLKSLAEDALYAARGEDKHMTPSSNDPNGRRGPALRALMQCLEVLADKLPEDFPGACFERGDSGSDLVGNPDGPFFV